MAAGSSSGRRATPRDRVVFGRPIGANQGVQFPIAQAYAHVEAADLVRDKAAALFDAGQRCGAEANMAKLLASEAAWEAANACMNTHGGYGFAVEYDVERKFREARLFLVAPDQQQPGAGVPRPARARHAELVLMLPGNAAIPSLRTFQGDARASAVGASWSGAGWLASQRSS